MLMSASKPLDVTLELAPRARFDVVDLRSRFAAEHEALEAYPRCLYWSFHTTAGFLDRSLAARLSAQHIPTYVDAFRTLFPEGAVVQIHPGYSSSHSSAPSNPRTPTRISPTSPAVCAPA